MENLLYIHKETRQKFTDPDEYTVYKWPDGSYMSVSEHVKKFPHSWEIHPVQSDQEKNEMFEFAKQLMLAYARSGNGECAEYVISRATELYELKKTI